jgi:hypothetical protein
MNDTSTTEPTINDLLKHNEENATGLDLMASLVDLSHQLIKLTNDQSTAPLCGDCLYPLSICGHNGKGN